MATTILLCSLAIVVGAIVAVQVAGTRGRDRFTVVVRCRAGHRFQTIWMPGGSLKAARLGTQRYQRCPVGRHWTLVARVDPLSVTAEERATLPLDTRIV